MSRRHSPALPPDAPHGSFEHPRAAKESPDCCDIDIQKPGWHASKDRNGTERDAKASPVGDEVLHKAPQQHNFFFFSIWWGHGNMTKSRSMLGRKKNICDVLQITMAAQIHKCKVCPFLCLPESLQLSFSVASSSLLFSEQRWSSVECQKHFHNWKGKVFWEQKRITHYCIMTRYMLKRKRKPKTLFSFFSWSQERRKPSINISSLAFQTAPKIAVTEKCTLVDDQNKSCPPGKESAREF